MAPAAASTTTFGVLWLKMAPFAAATTLLASRFNAPYPALPFLLLSWKLIPRAGVKSGTLPMLIKVATLASMHCAWSIVVTWAALKLVDVPLSGWHCLSIYIPFFLIASRPDASVGFSPLASALMDLLFNGPLVAAAYTLRSINLRLFPPPTPIDDRIVVSSLPFAADVPELIGTHRVCAVVNMCREWSGPASAYKEHGISQCRLPTQDTTMPSESQLRAGAKFIAAALETNPGRRVLVHCKVCAGALRALCAMHPARA